MLVPILNELRLALHPLDHHRRSCAGGWEQTALIGIPTLLARCAGSRARPAAYGVGPWQDMRVRVSTPFGV